MIRSYLYAPGSRPDLIPKAAASASDAVVIDLEDAVADEDKPAALENVLRFFGDGRHEAGGTMFFVRINGGDAALEDAKALAGLPIAGIRIPKSEDAKLVREVGRILDRTEQNDGAPKITIECLIESARGLMSLELMSRASPRVTRFGFGAGDYKRDIGARRTASRVETLYARGHLVVMSRLLGLLAPVAHVYTPIKDLEGLEIACQEDAALGFGARSCIHPSQIEMINACFGFTDEELERAQKIVEAYEDPATPNRGAFTLPDGTFVDLAIYRRALDVTHAAR